MKVAEIHIVVEAFLSSNTVVVGFDDADQAAAEYTRIADYLARRESRNNDLPRTIEIKGITAATVPLNKIAAVVLNDFAELNKHEAGVRDAFPHLFKK